MKNRWKRLASIAVGCVMASTVAFGFVGCGDKKPDGGDNSGDNTTYVAKKGTYRTFTSVMPSNWNLMTYEDNNDTQITDYINSDLFTYDYEFDAAKGGKFKADGSINVDAIVDGGFVTQYSAVSALEDVTNTVDAKWKYTPDQKKEGGYAWKITFRDDLKWDDGTVINADSFVYSMKEQLNPDFLNFRANTYYQTLMVKNARNYFYKNTDATYETVGSLGYESNQAAIDDGKDILLDVYTFYGAKGYVDAEGNPVAQWVSYKDTTEYNAPEVWELYETYDTVDKQEDFLIEEGCVFVTGIDDGKGGTYDAWTNGKDPTDKEYKVLGKTVEEAFAVYIGDDLFSGEMLWEFFFAPGAPMGYDEYVEVGQPYETWLGIRVENNGDRTVNFEDVGFYKAGENSVVICMDKSYQFLKKDGSLSYLAAYYMSSLPLVKEDLYERCKQEPTAGSTLWTTNYNTSKDTTASWGPYKLTQFQGGKSYTLERNENWYGYNMEENKNQYNVTKITCECIPEDETQWLSFLKGEIDDIGLDTDHIADYMYSKYATFTSTTGTYAMQLYSNLPVLKNNGRNNGILAIQEFRKAFSLSLNRDDVVEKIWPGTAIANYGALNSLYYYDIENGKTYRDSVQAKKALLRVYGFTENADGTWSNGANISNYSLEDAYEAMNGFNPELAKELLKEAYNKLEANPEYYGYDSSKDIVLIYGTQVDNPKQRQRAEYLQNILNTLAKDTPLEGKFKVEFNGNVGAKWGDAFKAGAYEIGFGFGFTGNALNPFDMISAFVDDSDNLNYHKYWKTSSETKTFTMPEGDYAESGKTLTMTLKNWFDCLNGYAELNGDEYTYNWDAGKVADDIRLEVLAMLEETALEQYYSVMLIAEYNGALLSPKFSYITYDYNLFMGYGGMRYFQVNYTDSEWTSYVSGQGGNLENEYKKAN
ncbi:MAG: hypothetical protein K2N23_06795 [Clostridia bacterium]|nr:hypothetical protein [Clostridia bacterium]